MEKENSARRTEDRRVKRTKKLLRECLFGLLEKKSIDSITVKELTEAADVNRSTFYFYYRDINDMMMQIQSEIYAVFEKEVIEPEASFETAEDFSAYILRFLRFCESNTRICRFVIGNDPNNNLTNMIKKAITEHIPDTKAVFGETQPERYLSTFAVSGFWQTAVSWLYDGMPVDAEKMADFMSRSYFFGGRSSLSSEN